MIRISKVLLGAALCCCVFAGSSVRAQAPLPRLYLDCGECEPDFFRQALNYFDWVRDRHEADYAISVVERSASNGGLAFTITLRHSRQPERPSAVRVVTTQADSQPAAVRAMLLDAILRCLHDVLRGTPYERSFSLVLPHRSERDLGAVIDGWDNWVFTPELLAELEAESMYFFLKLNGSLFVQRVTETSKFRSVTRYSRRSTSYELEDDERSSAVLDSIDERVLYAHSIGEHWALGGLAVAAWDEHANMKLHVHGGPALEWNVFPYAENANRQLRLAYQIGVWHSRYFEPTRLDGLHETRPYHALSLIVDLNQAWGSVQALVQLNSFIDKPKQWRLSCGLVLSVSVVAGLALQLRTEFARIEDQINLRAREPTEREIYLESIEFEKSFAIAGMFGFSYTFGSVYNTIVNPRFGRIDLEEEN